MSELELRIEIYVDNEWRQISLEDSEFIVKFVKDSFVKVSHLKLQFRINGDASRLIVLGKPDGSKNYEWNSGKLLYLRNVSYFLVCKGKDQFCVKKLTELANESEDSKEESNEAMAIEQSSGKLVFSLPHFNYRGNLFYAYAPDFSFEVNMESEKAGLPIINANPASDRDFQIALDD